jgi:hypothetical protein
MQCLAGHPEHGRQLDVGGRSGRSGTGTRGHGLKHGPLGSGQLPALLHATDEIGEVAGEELLGNVRGHLFHQPRGARQPCPAAGLPDPAGAAPAVNSLPNGTALRALLSYTTHRISLGIVAISFLSSNSDLRTKLRIAIQ